MAEAFRPSGRVVVTGMGGITPLGLSIEEWWPRIVDGHNGISLIERLDVSEYTTRIGGEIKNFDPDPWLDRRESKRMDPFIMYAIAASDMALADSFLDVDAVGGENIGVLIGSGIGGMILLGDQFRKLIVQGPSRVSPFLVPFLIPDMASGYVSIKYGLRGPNSCVVTACATGANSIGDAYHIVKRGEAIAMLAGGTEAPLNDISLAGFGALRAMSTRNDDPAHASRPFDADRDGFVPSEGSSVLVLEDYDHAMARGAKIYGEIVGYGMTADAYHITAPDPEGRGATRAMQLAVERAGITPDQVDYINAHGTSTAYNDKIETMAIKRVFGDYAYTLPVSSTKSMLGHSLGAAGAIEAVICLLSMRDNVVPPTINYQNPDPDCDLDYVPNESRSHNVRHVLSNSFGFGGHNVTLLFRKLD